ncbi:heavy metal translocating P-type ATPase [Salinarimonas soli]|uniref:Cadmium-translocating P-type ATPase n=1 Tax=Salinarimonas soli TaxID=1638099 RepID=A0A5B2VAQ5_9HYPH|nr:heavy metal translocating P-type ATPase [Salinarimonas soli]KAA2236091.1 cadmium-translocating P-type ATPase [Salinarimonas soli]
MTDRIDYSAFVRRDGEGGAALELAMDGVTCAACIGDIERGVASVPGLGSARLNYTLRRLTLRWEGEACDPHAVVERLERLGYKAYPFTRSREEEIEAAEMRWLLRCVGVGAFATMNVMLLSVSVWSGNATDIDPETRDLFHWISALIAIPAIAYAGQPFFLGAWRSIRARAMTMDVPISLGVCLAIALSLYETLHSQSHAYFDSAAMLLTFLLAGRALDGMMRRKTRAVAGNLLALRGEIARRVDPDGSVVEVPILAIKPGDHVLVRPGDRVPVDGVVTEGASQIDASLVTGETLTQAVGVDGEVHAGTLNIGGTLTIRAAQAAENSLVAEVNRLMDEALASRSTYVRIADRAARLYSPVVHCAALMTAIGWLAMGAGPHMAIVTAIAVLIITCPCALGLAVPAVQVVASGALFRSGVLLTAGDGIERIAACDTVVLDKTGTLTSPEARVTNRAAIDADLLTLATRLALSSSHPLARAVARDGAALAPVPGAVEEPGRGIRAIVDRLEVRLGSAEFCDAALETAIALAGEPDATPIVVRRGAESAVLLVRQALKDDARETVAALKALGLTVLVVSGDREGPVRRAAEAIGVAAWRAGCRPGDKVAILEGLKREGRRVLMVGDGLNDAPALAAAHASLSPIQASHAAQGCADALLLGERLRPALDAVRLSRRALGLMRQNLWISVAYNLVAVPLAVAGFVTPLVAAAAMSGSSVIVTLNALRAQAGTGARPQPAAPRGLPELREAHS